MTPDKAFWVLKRDAETTEPRFSKCFYDQDDATEYLPWYRARSEEEVWRSPSVVTLEVLPYGELPKHEA
jgi:hypothetical protein